MRLLNIKQSTNPYKKLMAIFVLDNGKKKIVHFGAKGYDDFTLHKDEERKRLYIKRHEANEKWSDPLTAGALSRYILWNKPTLVESIKDFTNRFKL
jgi:hypothetical protein